MTKVLFLDVDGVLNSTRDFRAMGDGNTHPLNEGSLALLQEVIKTTGCKVVVSSAWRQHDRTMTRLMSTRYLTIWDLYVGDFRTPRLDNKRGREIDQWLLNHPDVDCYAIVDDSSDMLEYQKSRFVQTNMKMGMCRQHADDLIKLLGKKNEKK